MGFGKDGKGVIIREDDIITLATLASKTVVKQDAALVMAEDFRMIKVRSFIHLHGGTFTDNDGPLIIGIANDELTVAEIKECLEANGPLNRNDRIPEERSMRAVFELAMLQFVEGGAVVQQIVETPLESIIRWTFSNPEGWTWFAYNFGGSALATGGVIKLRNKYFGVWVQ